jgi:hypothetical protein
MTHERVVSLIKIFVFAQTLNPKQFLIVTNKPPCIDEHIRVGFMSKFFMVNLILRDDTKPAAAAAERGSKLI